MLANNMCGFLVTFVVPGGKIWSIKTLNLDAFKTKLVKLFCVFLYNFVY